MQLTQQVVFNFEGSHEETNNEVESQREIKPGDFSMKILL